MIRWYDYILAIILADIIFATLIVFVTAPNMFIAFFSSFSLFFLFELWNKYYCEFRLKLEENKK